MNFRLSGISAKDNIFTKPMPDPVLMGDAQVADKKRQSKEEETNQNSSHTTDTIRMNDYDYNLLQRYAYKDLDDDVFKLECKIASLEYKLSNLNMEIKMLESLDSGIQMNDLRFKRDLMEVDLERMKKEYAKLSVSTGISSYLANMINKFIKEKILLGGFATFLKSTLSRFSKNYKYSVEVKDALNSLQSINSGVNNLVRTQSPYGEADFKYEKLAAFLTRANHVQANVLLAKRK